MTRALTPLALALLLLAPAAAAHTTASSADGKLRVVVGQLNEPVVTYSKSGLDVCLTQNTTAREPVTANPGDLVATLRSPSGGELSLPLRAQFGRAGCYQFEEPYILTEPGQYVLDLKGTAAGSPVDLRGVKAGGPVADQGNITFPQQVPDLRGLQAQVTALQARVQQLEAADAAEATKPAKGAPLPMAALLLAALALAAVAARRRQA